MAGKKIPSNVTNKEWQKAKGLLGKITLGKTDVGAPLEALEKEYNSSVFAKGVTDYGGLDPVEFKNNVAAMKAEMTKDLSAIKAKAITAEKAANAAAVAAKGDKKVPASIGKYLGELTKNLNNLANDLTVEVGSWEAEAKKAYKARLPKTLAGISVGAALPKMLTKYNLIYKNISNVEAAPTRATIKSEFGTDCPARGLTTACKTWDQEVTKSFPTASKAIYGGKAMDEFFKLPLLSPFATEKGVEAVEKLMTSSGKTEQEVVLSCMKILRTSVDRAGPIMDHFKALAKVVESV